MLKKLTALIVCGALLMSMFVVSAKSPEIDTTKYPNQQYAKYINYRNPLVNTYKKLTEDKELRIEYFGGSVTSGYGSSLYCWRTLTMDWFDKTFPEAKITHIASSLGESGTFLGTYRLQRDVIEQNPDLVFVEYAINDRYKGSSMEQAALQYETIVREIKLANPNCDIVTILVTDSGVIDLLPKLYPCAAGHEMIAEAYGIPTLNVGYAVKDAMGEHNEENWFKYFVDSVHPTDAGYHKYYDCIEEFLENSLLHTDFTDLEPVTKLPLIQSEHLLDGNRQSILGADLKDIIVSSKNFNYSGEAYVDYISTPHYGVYQSFSTNENAYITFRFNGTELALWCSFYASERLAYSLDGAAEVTIAGDAHAPVQVVSGLEPGEHTIKIRPVAYGSGGAFKIHGVLTRDETLQSLREVPTIDVDSDDIQNALDNAGFKATNDTTATDIVNAIKANGYSDYEISVLDFYNLNAFNGAIERGSTYEGAPTEDVVLVPGEKGYVAALLSIKTEEGAEAVSAVKFAIEPTMEVFSFASCSSDANWSVDAAGVGTYDGGNNFEKVIVPDNVKTLPQDWTSWKGNIKCIVYGTGMTFLDRNLGLSGLKVVSFKEGCSITAIANLAFYGASSLKYIRMPDTVRSIGGECFRGAPFEQLYLSSALESIDTNIFAKPADDKTYFHHIKQIEIPSTVTYIGGNCFNGAGDPCEVTIASKSNNFWNKNAFYDEAYSDRGENFTLRVWHDDRTATADTYYACANEKKYIEDMGVCEAYTRAARAVDRALNEPFENADVLGAKLKNAIWGVSGIDTKWANKTWTVGDGVIENKYSVAKNGYVLEVPVVIPFTSEHIPSAAVIENTVDATCTDDGSYETVIYCADCGAEISRETHVVKAFGHTYNDGVVTNESTCIKNGIKTFTCITCKNIYTEQLPLTDHKYVLTDSKEATETEAGYNSYTCSGCQKKRTIIVPATGADSGFDIQSMVDKTDFVPTNDTTEDDLVAAIKKAGFSDYTIDVLDFYNLNAFNGAVERGSTYPGAVDGTILVPGEKGYITAIVSLIDSEGSEMMASLKFTIEPEMEAFKFSSCSTDADWQISSTGVGTFSGVRKYEKIIVPDAVKSLGTDWLTWDGIVKCMVYGTGISLVPRQIGLQGLQVVSFKEGNNVTALDGLAFYGANYLKYIRIPDTVTFLGPEAFRGNVSMEQLYLPEGLTQICQNIFYKHEDAGVHNLKNIVIPSTVTSMNGEAFTGAGRDCEVTILSRANTFWYFNTFYDDLYPERGEKYTLRVWNDSRANTANKSFASANDKLYIEDMGVCEAAARAIHAAEKFENENYYELDDDNIKNTLINSYWNVAGISAKWANAEFADNDGVAKNTLVLSKNGSTFNVPVVIGVESGSQGEITEEITDIQKFFDDNGFIASNSTTENTIVKFLKSCGLNDYNIEILDFYKIKAMDGVVEKGSTYAGAVDGTVLVPGEKGYVAAKVYIEKGGKAVSQYISFAIEPNMVERAYSSISNTMDDWQFVDGNGYQYTGNSVDKLVVPDEITTLYDGWWPNWFNSKSMKCVVFGTGLEYIPKSTGMSAEVVSFKGNTVKTIAAAFHSDSNLKYIHLPDSLKYLGEQAFRKCTSLEWLYIPYGVETIAGTLFYVPKEDNNPDGTLNPNLAYHVTEITVPETVKSIVGGSFVGAAEDCNITFLSHSGAWSWGIWYDNSYDPSLAEHIYARCFSNDATYLFNYTVNDKICIDDMALAEVIVRTRQRMDKIAERSVYNSVDDVNDAHDAILAELPYAYGHATGVTLALDNWVVSGATAESTLAVTKGNATYNIPVDVEISATVLRGDVNGDGEINVLDIVRLKKLFADQTDDVNVPNSDVDGNGNIEAADLTCLRKLIAS